MKIGHVRIDDRLIHGQIVASWINVLHCTTIVVADDKAAADPLQSMMLQMACPPSIQLKLMKISEAGQYLLNAQVDCEKLLVIVRNVENALLLTDVVTGIEKINVGNVSSAAGRKKFSKSVWLSETDIENFRKLHMRGIALEVRVVPNEKATDLMAMLGK